MQRIPRALRSNRRTAKIHSPYRRKAFMSSTAAPKLSPERIFTTLTAYQQTYALRAAIELDLFTAIGEGANEPALLAKRLKAAERGVRILADYLTVHGFLCKENGE